MKRALEAFGLDQDPINSNCQMTLADCLKER
jgi:hypothetical protein